MVEILNEAERIYILAAGTSYHAGLVAQYQFAEMAKRPAQTVISSEFQTLVADVIDEGATVLGITQSGETADTLRALRVCHEKGAKILSITNVLGSSVTRFSDSVAYTRAGPEIGVAATKTYTTQLAILSGISILLGENTGKLDYQEAREYWSHLEGVPEIMQADLEGLELEIKTLAGQLAQKWSCFYSSILFNTNLQIILLTNFYIDLLGWTICDRVYAQIII